MSDNTSDSEQQQQMKKIFICADVWLEVFAFIDPVELGLKLALISDRFDFLVDEHFKLRKWSLSSLQILRATDGNGAEIFNKHSGEVLPIPQRPLPNKVIGFKAIKISYIDQTVIEFLQRICRLFNSSGTNVYIATFDFESRSWEIIWQKIWPLFKDNICRFLFMDSSQLGRLRQISPAILRNCAKLRSIASTELYPEFPAEDNAGASFNQALAKWLLTPRGDGFPKMLFCNFYSTELEALKRSFVNALESVNFIICFAQLTFHVIEPFELKNNWTGDRLALRQMDENFWLLVCCPIVREEDKWAKWEKEANELYLYYQWNRILIDFEDRDIGDGMLDDSAGPSEPKK